MKHLLLGVCLMCGVLPACSQEWDIVKEYDTSFYIPFFQKFYKNVVFQDRLYIANLPLNKRTFHGSFDGLHHRYESRINEVASFVKKNGGGMEFQYFNLGDTSLLFTMAYDGFNDSLYSEIWRFDPDTSVQLSKYVPIHGVNRAQKTAVVNENFYAFLAPHSKAPSGKDSVALVKVENGISDTLTYFTSGGEIWGASNKGILIRGKHRTANGQIFPGWINKTYWEDGVWTIPDQDMQNVGKYIPYLDGFLYADLLTLTAPADPKARITYFDGVNVHFVGDPAFKKAYGVEKYKNEIYVTATEDDSLTNLYRFDGSDFHKVFTLNDLSKKSRPSAKLYEIHFLKDYCYLSGHGGVFVSNTEKGYVDSLGTLVRLPMYNDNNLAPEAFEETVQINDTTIVNLSVNSNDIDPNDDYLYVAILQQGMHGTAVLDSGTDEIVYTPNFFFEGTDSIHYSVCDLGGLCDSAWVKVNVSSVALPLSLSSDQFACLEDEDSSYAVFDNDGFNNQSITHTLVDTTKHGESYFLPNGQLWYAPDTTYFGPDSCKYEVCTTFGMCVQEWVYFDVILVNEAPMAVSDSFLVTSNSQVLNVLQNDSDFEGENMFTTIVDGPFHPNALVQIESDRHIRYMNPEYDVFVSDSVQYMACDIHNYCDTAWLYLNQNHQPTAQNDTLRLTGNMGDVHALLNDSDPDNHELHYFVIAGPYISGNTFYSCGIGCRTYINHSGDSFLRDSVQYVLGDEHGAVDTAWIQIEAEDLNVYNLDFTSKLYIYPNPATDYVRIQSDLNGTVKLYSLQGALIKAQNFNRTTQVSVEGLAEGIYFLEISNGAKKLMRKIRVQ